jgi:murein DD-endopeptidase MepM/ murein hydrolase activator NlpD
LASVGEKLRETARKFLPARQILIRGTGPTVAVEVSHRLQLRVAAGLALALVWLLGSSLALGALLTAKTATAALEHHLQAEIAANQARLREVTAENALLAQQRNAALAQASIIQQQARALAASASARAAARASSVAANDTEKLAELNQQTATEISRVEGIIRAAGLNPAVLTGARAPGPAASAPGSAELLRQDLGQLRVLGNLLGQMPLASPVAQISITSGYGYRADPFTGAREFHVGIDLRGPIGAPIYATAPGTVTFAGWETGYGQIVEVDHGYGLSTRYSHLDRILVRAGERVALHQVVGLMGDTGWSTGPHLLYETRLDGQPANPLNFIKVSLNDVQN